MCFSGSTLDSSSLVPGSNPAAGAADQAERWLGQRSGRGGSPPSRVGGGGAHCYWWQGRFFVYCLCAHDLFCCLCAHVFFCYLCCTKIM